MTLKTKTIITFEEEELDTINKARDILYQMCDAIQNCEMCPLKNMCADIGETPADYLRNVLIKTSKTLDK
jgi:hypothetical protein